MADNGKKCRPVHIEKFLNYREQMCQLGSHLWSVSRLIELSKELPIMEIPIMHLNVYCFYEKLTLRDMATHFDAAINADLSKPIILDEDGEIMDGRHRIIKTLVEKKTTIKAVRFDKNPTPCEIKKN